MGLKHRILSAYLPEFLESWATPMSAWARGTVLMYHEVLPDNVDIPAWTVVKASRFREQMIHIRKNYDVLTLDQALERVYDRRGGSGKRTRHFVVVTFDDGYAGNLHYALPILESLNVPCTIYLATSKIQEAGHYWYDKILLYLLSMGDQRFHIFTSRGALEYWPRNANKQKRWQQISRVLDSIKTLPEIERQQIVAQLPAPPSDSLLRMLTPAEVSTLADVPLVTLGCHTHNHDLLDQLALDDVRSTIREAQDLIRSWTGTTPSHFCYPNGNYSDPVIDLVKEMGFRSATITIGNPWTCDVSPYEIPRARIGRFDSVPLFRAKLSGILNE